MNTKEAITEAVLEGLDVPASAYEQANMRYQDLGQWLHDPARASSARHDPHVFPQGSFRLGTVVRPLTGDDFDLDLGCELRQGLVPGVHSQHHLKSLVGGDLEKYRIERGIKEKLEEKHRCWRLVYQDSPSFHMDVVPCVPHLRAVQQRLNEDMSARGLQSLAAEVSRLAVAITDDRHPNYRAPSGDWLPSNPEGYARWFENAMRTAEVLLESKAAAAYRASIDAIPTYQWQSPLQQCVKLLKRHRDLMFRNNPDPRPISIIITTLAGRSYDGETSVEAAMRNILTKMESHIDERIPRVPNPVNPKEDFTDRWRTPEGIKLRLEDNFRIWLRQAQRDFRNLSEAQSRADLRDTASDKFGVPLSESAIERIAGLESGRDAVPVITVGKSGTAQPWRA